MQSKPHLDTGVGYATELEDSKLSIDLVITIPYAGGGTKTIR